VCGATTVISKEDPAGLKKTSLVEGRMPTVGSSVGTKGARATTFHGGGGGLGGCVGGLGGEGQLSVEFGQSPLYAIASSSKAGVPAHAQRMSSLLASDKELFAPCRESKGGRV